MEYLDIRMAYGALRDGQKTAAEILTMYQATPDKKAAHQNGDTLLHLAAANLDLGAVAYLLGEGCDPSALNDSGHTPLWMVAKCRELTPDVPKNTVYDLTAALLNAGASPMKKDGDGRWCYLEAARNGNGEFLAALFDKGARITRTDGDGNNGLHLLIESLSGCVNDYQQAQEKYEKSVRENADPATVEHQRKRAEDLAARMEYRVGIALRGVKALLDAGVDPEDKNNMGETAHLLAERRGAKRIGALLRGEVTGDEASSGQDEDADAALRLKAGGLTLHQAVGKSDEEAVRALAGLGADLDEVDDIFGYGEGTPLALACWKCDLPMCELLLELGADPNVRAGNGTTALSWLSASHNPREVRSIFAENWPARIIAAMVAAGLDINAAVDDQSNTLLTFALRDSRDLDMFTTRETLRWLIVDAAIAHGADVNKTNAHGQTPLMLASKGNPKFDMRMADEIQLLLLENGADVGPKDRDGNTALHYAARNGGAAAAKEMAENLFDYGSPTVDAVNNAGKTALDYAQASDNELLVRFLLGNM